jgi:quercetin dioxygenase-like cupin family protein
VIDLGNLKPADDIWFRLPLAHMNRLRLEPVKRVYDGHLGEDLMVTDGEGVALLEGEEKSVSLGGAIVVFKATGKETGGAYALLEYTADPGAGSGMHRHFNEDESFYILDGALTFQIEERKIKATPGQFVFITRGARHAFVNAEAQPVKCLIFISPAGLEGFFEELGAMLAANPSGPSNEEVKALAARYKVEI